MGEIETFAEYVAEDNGFEICRKLNYVEIIKTKTVTDRYYNLLFQIITIFDKQKITPKIMIMTGWDGKMILKFLGKLNDDELKIKLQLNLKLIKDPEK